VPMKEWSPHHACLIITSLGIGFSPSHIWTATSSSIESDSLVLFHRLGGISVGGRACPVLTSNVSTHNGEAGILIGETSMAHLLKNEVSHIHFVVAARPD